MIIQSKRVWINEELKPAQIEIKGSKITGIYDYNEKEACKDYGDKMILPGLVDMHCHGYKGFSLNYANKEGLDIWREAMVKEGVTSFVATTWTAPEAELLKSFKVISDEMKNDVGANILGIYVEGPLISFRYGNAHNPYLIQKPTIEKFKRYQKAADGNIKLVTIASEMDKDHQLIKYCSENGVVVALGHTDATYEECVEAKNDGARCFTHTFNAMKGIHHRKPGVAGASLSMDDMYSELICDGVHVSNPVAKITARSKSKDNLILITDSVKIKGLEPGVYELEGNKLVIGEDHYARTFDGFLAGSPNCLNECLKNAVENCDMPLVQAVNACTINPLNLLGISNKGLIKENYDADIVVMDDNYIPVQTMISGIERL